MKYEKLYQFIQNYFIDLITNDSSCALIGVLEDGRIGLIYSNTIIYADGFDRINPDCYFSVLPKLKKIYRIDKLGFGTNNLKKAIEKESPVWEKPKQVVLSKEEIANRLGIDPDYLEIK